MASLAGVITDPYYDPASGTIMASCSAPVFDEDGSYVGCITCDIYLDTVSEIVGNISIGDTGVAMLTMADGTYIHTEDMQKVENAENLSGDYPEVASVLLSEESGQMEETMDGTRKDIYFATVPEQGWRLLVTLDAAEVSRQVGEMMKVAVPICIIAVLACSILIFFIAGSIEKSIVGMERFALELSKGNFDIDEVDASRRDEIGSMGDSLNRMFGNNKEVIRSISESSDVVNSASNELNTVAGDLSDRFMNIRQNMSRVNDAMTSAGASTEEVSASTNEVNVRVENLAEKTADTAKEVEEIKKRAMGIEEGSRKACAKALSITKEKGEQLEKAAEKAEVVNEISSLAGSIAAIASEINLLSLNATIEAARAGEHGRGFAVVAAQINSLVGETESAVEGIQETITAIQEAFAELNESAKGLLDFVTEVVAPDYEKFEEVGKQYGGDASSFGELTDQISQMVDYIKDSMNQVNQAVLSIAESSQDTAASSSDVADTVNEVSGMVEKVTEMARDQEETAEKLSDIVSKFNLG